jgi:putative ABC transport system permease protein
MLFSETLRVAVEALRANKLRSFLTMLGIVIGVAAVIAMVALGRGAQQSVKDRIAALGTTLLTVTPGQARGAGRVASATDRAPLTLDDAAALQQRGTYMVAIQPEMSRNLQVQYEGRNTNTSVVGTTANYLDVRQFQVAAGRMFSNAEDAARRRVAVLGSQVVDDLALSAATVVGEAVRIDGVQFEVIGVLASKGQGGGFANPDDQVATDLHRARRHDRQRSPALDQSARTLRRRHPGHDGRGREDPAARAPAAAGPGR